MPTCGVFLHPKQNWDAERIAEALESITRLMGTGSLVSGREVYDAHFKKAGRNWDRWAIKVATGRNLDGTPYYDFFVVPGDSCARATAAIVSEALKVGKPVLAWNEDLDAPVFARVTQIYDSEPSNRWHGWRLVTV